MTSVTPSGMLPKTTTTPHSHPPPSRITKETAEEDRAATFCGSLSSVTKENSKDSAGT